VSDPFTYKLFRFSSAENSTLGLLMAGAEQKDSSFRCFTLEDEHREVKEPGRTRIPAGKYEIKLRQGSPTFAHYDKRWIWHKGMLWLQDVPGFEWIYIHPGNRHEHTEGCILCGDGSQSNVIDDGMVTSSRQAYERLYREMSQMLGTGKQVFLTIEDWA